MKAKTPKKDDSRVRLFVDHQEVIAGDAISVAVIFHNLTGRNFDKSADPKLEFGQWLTMMEHEWQRPLTAGLDVVVRDADMIAKLAGYIGSSMQRPDPQMGQQCLVRTFPYGAPARWSLAKMSSWKEKSPVNNELFHFSAREGCYPVTRETLLERCWPLGAAVLAVSILDVEVCLSPVPMSRMPSENAEDWLKFLKGHVPNGSLKTGDANRMQRFMKEHKTEALTDGIRNFTLAGGLAYCDPSLGTPAEVVPLV